ncbi:MAG: Serine hydroxymethyltransferase [Holosporales bacterium]
MNHQNILDTEIAIAIQKELKRQQEQIELIASENIVSPSVMAAQGSVLTNKYAEGYPSDRYYNGCEYVDIAESLAIERAKQLFSCAYANVQPHSGSQANMAAFLALLNPGDTILGMGLSSGGHLTHGSSVSMSGKWFSAVHYAVDPKTNQIDYDEVESIARRYKPRLIIAGGSSYSRMIDFKRFRQISDNVGAYLMVDMAHFAGLVAAGLYDSPLPYADIVTSTTHKTLRGPRGGLILSNNADMKKKINSAVFPGIQGGPLMHVIAAKAVAFHEALQPEFKQYAQQVIDNAKALCASLQEQQLDITSGGTDTHLLLVDLRKLDLSGLDLCQAMEKAHLTCNKNSLPFDEAPPSITSGIRLGSPACTTRGFREEEFRQIGTWIGQIAHAFKEDRLTTTLQDVKEQALQLCARFPIYPDLNM